MTSPFCAEISFCVLACSFVQRTVFHFPLILIVLRTVFHGQILSSSNDFSCMVNFPWQSVLCAERSDFPLLASARSAHPVFPRPSQSHWVLLDLFAVSVASVFGSVSCSHFSSPAHASPSQQGLAQPCRSGILLSASKQSNFSYRICSSRFSRRSPKHFPAP
jgi:hypothetical protein